MDGDHSLNLRVLPDTFAVCRLDPSCAIPDWAACDDAAGEFISITRTADALSIVCRESRVPNAGITCERSWRALQLQGPFDFEQIGILASVARPLAEARVSILAISTYDTDYVLVKAAQLEQAILALTRFGHVVEMASAGAREIVPVKCAWRLPGNIRIRATFDAEVIAYDVGQDRWLVKLIGLRTIAAGTDADARSLIESQVGRWAYVPGEARRGLTLPLKYETLTGKIRFFYATDPRETR